MTDPLTDFQARLQVGTRLLCVANTKHPNLNGAVRLVTSVDPRAFAWRRLAADRVDPETSATMWPPAAAVTRLDPDTFRIGLFWNATEPVMTADGTAATLTLRFLPEPGAAAAAAAAPASRLRALLARLWSQQPESAYAAHNAQG